MLDDMACSVTETLSKGPRSVQPHYTMPEIKHEGKLDYKTKAQG